MKDSIPVSQGGQVAIKIDGKKPNALYYKQIRNQSIYENIVEKKGHKKNICYYSRFLPLTGQ